MKTFVLPGYSTKNKEWTQLTANSINGEAIEWEHWSNPTAKFETQKEVNNILEKIGDEKVNIIAKSVGTFVLMKVLEKRREVFEKIILCGVPFEDLNEDDKS